MVIAIPMMRNRGTTKKLRRSFPLVVYFFGFNLLGLMQLAGIGWSRTEAAIPPQSEAEIAPGATPQIRRVTPNQVSPGSEVTVVIEGRDFSSGAYVSFSDPTIHVISTRRASPIRLEIKLAIDKNARLGKVTLYASNPASTVAESTFTIAASAAPVAPAAPATTPPPIAASEAFPSAPAIPIPSAAAVVPAAKPPSEVQPTESGAPGVTKVAPPSAGRGSAIALKVTGKNFAPGARLAFSNPGIQVLERHVNSAKELGASIQIASDAALGATGMFVVNPDDSETESSFEVTDATPTIPPTPAIQPTATGGAGTASAKQSAKTIPSTPGAGFETQRFDIYNLENGIAILQNPRKSKGTLKLTKGNLRYEEDGNEIFSVSLRDIQEVDQNSVFGMKTGTFHIILKTGKSYNFIAPSLHAADTQAIVDSLQAALK